MGARLAHKAPIGRKVASTAGAGTQFTCFTRTKVQILTGGERRSWGWGARQCERRGGWYDSGCR